MLHKHRSSLGGRKVSPPQPVCMSADQKASYLADLRNHRPARPSGGRPLPSRPLPAPAEDVPPRSESAMSFHQVNEPILLSDTVASREQKLTHRASMPSTNSYGSLAGHKGRPLVSSPFAPSHRKVSPSSGLGTEYKETLERIKEREEAHILRQALEKIDVADDERRIHNAAKMEAADLVWKHQYPTQAEAEKTAAYQNPDLEKASKYGQLGHAKKASGSIQPASHSQSRSSSGESAASTDSKRHRLPWLRKRPQPPTNNPVVKPITSQESLIQKGVRKISGKRQTSSGSSKGVFRNPEDEIYEDPEVMPAILETGIKEELPLTTRQRNSLPRGTRPLPEKSHTDPCPEHQRPSRTIVARALPVAPVENPDIIDNQQVHESIRYKDGYEVRGDDIRAATSMRRSDRSPNLPTPTAVSDKPGRPIVSFDSKWKSTPGSPRHSFEQDRPKAQKDEGSVAYPVKPRCPVPEVTIMEDSRSPALQRESVTVPHNQSAIPTVAVPEISISDLEPEQEKGQTAIPLIHLPDDDPPSMTVPMINVQASVPEISIEQGLTKSRPLPTISPSQSTCRPQPSHTQSSPSQLPPMRPTHSEIQSRVPWLSRAPTTTSSTSVTCNACRLPISGRIVTASGSTSQSQKARFHPECFSCHHCSTSLECVSFYPEPTKSRVDRLIESNPDLEPEAPETQQWASSNEDLHFFCHLDYHELFSPRCHTCKTPIETSVVLALGRHYHAEHFFCAECGDPFTSQSPFVEHNDYPYCVSCHTKRTSARCKGCKAPVLNEVVVEALGGKWHDKCFVCCDCEGEFGDEGRFFVREIEVRLTEKQMRKGMGPMYEEKAACQDCEERRVKNINIFL